MKSRVREEIWILVRVSRLGSVRPLEELNDNDYMLSQVRGEIPL